MNFIIAIGGTGARIVESFVYYAAAGAVPGNDDYKIFVVDKDKDCGNTGRLRRTVGQYMDMKKNAAPKSCMMPSFECENWNLDTFMESLCKETNPGKTYDADTAVYRHLVRPNTEDQTILNIFHRDVDQNQQLKNGFYGCANLGSAILDEIFKTKAFGDKTSNPLFVRISQALAANGNKSVNIVLAASIFGGTGASIFPNMALKFRTEFPNSKIHGVLMLPYFYYGDGGALTDDNAAHAAIRWDVFRQKTAIALESYSNIQNLVQVGNTSYDRDNNNFRFNSLKFIGAETLRKSCSVDTPGGPGQAHKFLAADLFAAQAIRDAFFRTPTDSAYPNIYSHSYTSTIDASAVGLEDTKMLQRFTEFAFAVRAYAYPVLHCPDVNSDDLIKKPFNIGLFRGNSSLNMEKLKLYVKSTVPFCDAFLNYMLNIHSDLDCLDSGRTDVKLINYIGLKKVYEIVLQKQNIENHRLRDFQAQVLNEIERENQHILIDESMKVLPQEYLKAWRAVSPASKQPNSEEGYQSIMDALYNHASEKIS